MQAPNIFLKLGFYIWSFSWSATSGNDLSPEYYLLILRGSPDFPWFAAIYFHWPVSPFCRTVSIHRADIELFIQVLPTDDWNTVKNEHVCILLTSAAVLPLNFTKCSFTSLMNYSFRHTHYAYASGGHCILIISVFLVENLPHKCSLIISKLFTMVDEPGRFIILFFLLLCITEKF